MKTQQEMEKYAAEVLDPDKVQLQCGEHGYKPGTTTGMPRASCPNCWMAFYVYSFARISPDKREEFMESLERGVVDACAQEDKGKMDFIPSRKQEITIEKA